MSRLQLPAAPAEGQLRLVMIGDIVGKPGMRITCNAIPWLRQIVQADVIVANAENAADGSGLRCKDYRRLVEHGVDVITLGDHVFRKREIMEVLDKQTNIVRPGNLPDEAPGKGWCEVTLGNELVLTVMSVLGRVFMKPVDCPFRAVDRMLEHSSGKIRLIDFHAEATSDKQLMGRYLDGRVSAVVGTHTHVATADEQILPGGTAFQCDVGMTGPFESILGRKIAAVQDATLNALPTPFQVATGNVRMNASWIDVDATTGLGTQIGRLNLDEATLNEYLNPGPITRPLL